MCERKRGRRPGRTSVAVGWLLVTAQIGYGTAAAFTYTPRISDMLLAERTPGVLDPERSEKLGLKFPPDARLPESAPPIVFAQAPVAARPDTDAAVPPANGGTDAGGAAAKEKFRWTIAPFRWGGTLGNELRMHQAGDQAQRRQIVNITQLRGATYLWQPWFAQVSGGLGIVSTKERSAPDPGSTLGHNSRSDSLTGNGTVSMFPGSRFPFQALFDMSDSRASSELTTSDFTGTRVGIRQNYQTPAGDSHYTGSFDRSTLRSAGFGRDTVDVLAAGMNGRQGDHTYDVTGNHTRNTRGRNGERSMIDRLTARHSYRPEESMLSVETLASVSGSDFRLRNSNDTLSQTSTRFVQLNSFGTWRPEEGHPLFVTGGARVFQSTIDNGATAAESRSLSGYGSASYAVNRNLSVAGSASVTQSTSQTVNALVSNQAGTVTYLPDVRRLGEYVYTQNATATLVNFTGGQDGSRQNVAGQVGHNVMRAFPLGERSSMSVNAGQNFASNYDTVTAASQTFSHNAAVTWRMSPSPATSTYVSLMGVDSRTHGHNENQFQMLNAQASGQVQIGRYSFTGGNITAQGTRQQTPSAPEAPLSWNTNGNLNYQHVRAFNVAGLRYYALYSVNETQYRSRLQGDINAPRDRVNQSFEQRLLYNIGRIEVRLTARVARIEGQRNSLIFLRVSRNIGNY